MQNSLENPLARHLLKLPEKASRVLLKKITTSTIKTIYIKISIIYIPYILFYIIIIAGFNNDYKILDYTNMWKIILSSFLIVNALFWGLFPHTEKCEMSYFLGIQKCPSFLVHALIGTIFYIFAILIVHFNSFSIIFGQ